MKRLVTYLFLVAFSISWAKAQKISYVLLEQKMPGELFKSIYSSTDSVLFFSEAGIYLQQVRSKGFLEASADSVSATSKEYRVFLTLHKRYNWVALKPGNTRQEALREAGFKERHFSGRPFQAKKLNSLKEKILVWHENNGYPFCTVKLDSILVSGGEASAMIITNPGKFIKIDSISLKGKAGISSNYLEHLLEIKAGDPYREKNISQIGTRINNTGFLREKEPFKVVFTEKYSKLVLHVENKKANQADGVLGFMPDEKTGKVLVTGQAKLQLENALGKGEYLMVDWRKMQPLTQDLKARFVYPFFLKTPFGPDAGIKLYKRDTTFIDVQLNGGIQYYFKGMNSLRAFVNNRSTNLISTVGLDLITRLPEYADVNTLSYGIGLKTERTDYRLNPRKGYRIQLQASAGTKKISINPSVNPLAYNGVNLKSSQFSGESSAELFLPVYREQILLLGQKSGFIAGPQLFTNELMRIGGFQTLRGFDEESIYASAYAIGTVEHRYRFSSNTFWFNFFNAAFYENNSVAGYTNDTPFGFGTGLSFESRAGIFSISWALGKQLNNPLLLRAAKIHFGIISVF